MTHSEPFRRAIVAGSSMAGLLAARVLSDYFEEVVILERDTLPDGPVPRKGVPQGRQLHGLLSRGSEILEDLFPGLIATLIKGGSTRVDSCHELAWHHYGMWKQRTPSGVYIYTQSRPYLEWHVRRHVLQRKNISVLERQDVAGFLVSADGRRIRGVSTRKADASESTEMLADLVVDATGRQSKTPERLEALGYPRVSETKVTVDVGYSTQIFTRTEHEGRDWKAMMLYPTPPNGTRCGMLFPAEQQRWLATVVGWTRDYPPGDHDGFMEYARSLEDQAFYEVIKNEQPLTDVMSHRFPSNLRRHYERMSRFPVGLCVIGDALCSFNPSYGQGMTAAACSAEILQKCLKAQGSTGRSIADLTRDYRRKVPEAIGIPWQVAVGEDYNWPGVEGPPSRWIDLNNAYLRRIHRMAPSDEELCKTFVKLVNMLLPPSTIYLDPKFVLRLAGRSLQAMVGMLPAPGPAPLMGTPMPTVMRSGIPGAMDVPGAVDEQIAG